MYSFRLKFKDGKTQTGQIFILFLLFVLKCSAQMLPTALKSLQNGVLHSPNNPGSKGSEGEGLGGVSSEIYKSFQNRYIDNRDF